MDQFLRTVATFALLGPLVGVGVIWIGLVGLVIFSGDDAWYSSGSLLGYLMGVPGAVLLSLVFGYLFGILPAAATGVICHLFARTIRSNALWLIACAAVGCTSGIAALATIDNGWSDWLSLGLFAVPGSVAATVCAYRLRRSRWAN